MRINQGASVSAFSNTRSSPVLLGEILVSPGAQLRRAMSNTLCFGKFWFRHVFGQGFFRYDVYFRVMSQCVKQWFLECSSSPGFPLVRSGEFHFAVENKPTVDTMALRVEVSRAFFTGER